MYSWLLKNQTTKKTMHATDEVLNTVLAHWSCLESTGHGSTEILCQGSAFTRKGTKSHGHDLWDHNKARSCFKQCHLSAPGLPMYKMMPLIHIPSVLAQTTQSWTSHHTRKEHQQDLFASVSLEHISISRAPTPRFKYLRSAPLMMVWFSAAEFFYQWKGYPIVKIQKDQRKPMIHQKHWLISLFSWSSASHVCNYVQSAWNLKEL